jgi:hypothetical protein
VLAVTAGTLSIASVALGLSRPVASRDGPAGLFMRGQLADDRVERIGRSLAVPALVASGQKCDQGHARAADPALHGSGRDVKHLRGFVVREPANAHEDQGFTMLVSTLSRDASVASAISGLREVERPARRASE